MIGRLVIGMSLAALLAAALFRVWVHQSVIEAGYAISEARSHARSLAKEKKELEVELSALRSPERLQSTADDAGLRPMQPSQLYVVQVEVQP
ncbi:MAG: hypothetical protein AAF658_05700 [Myxococcota bacterium]